MRGGGASSFTADHRSVITTASKSLSKTVPTSASELVDHVQRLFDEVLASQEATAKAEKEV